VIVGLALLAFLAAVVQSLAGFGFALIVMPVFAWAMGLGAAAPLVALVALTLFVVNVIRFRHAINRREVARLTLGAALGVPVGIWALSTLDESLILRVLGVVLTAYALFALLRPALPPLTAPGWAYPTGFLAGCLGGAYNTPGPPVILYGSLRQFPKDEFRAVMQSVYLLTGLLTVASHALAGNLVRSVWLSYALLAPAALLGIWVGARLDGRLNQERFRTFVAVVVLLLGLSLLLGLGRR
jgi:uncharacterized protein